LPQRLGSYPVDTGAKASAMFNMVCCGSNKDQDAIGCLSGQMLVTKLNLGSGSLACPSILQAVANADTFLEGQTVNGVGGINYIGPSGT
jgi:hypothetical protein